MRRATNLLGLVCAACSAAPGPALPQAARPVVEVERWEIRIEDDVRGHVLAFEIQDAAGPLRFYRIQDEQGRWLGHATAGGRFSRRVPFRDDEDLGVLPMARGAALLLGVDGVVVLRRVPPVAGAPR